MQTLAEGSAATKRLKNTAVESFWKSVSKDRFPKLKDFALKMRSMFGNTYVYIRGREPMAREPDVALSMTASGSLDIFLIRLLRMNIFL